MEEEHHQKRQSKRVQWDQEKLKQTEKTRGMFQKIPQPKTPYEKRNLDSSGDQDNSQNGKKSQEQIEIEKNLEKAKHNQVANSRKKINLAQLNDELNKQLQEYRHNQEMQIEEEQQSKRKHEQFKKMRAQHYNEFKKIQQMQKHGWEDQDDQ